MLVQSWNRTWSLPRPVAPWPSTVMPRFRSSGISPATMTCRPMPVVFQYAPSYRAWNCTTSTPLSAIMSWSGTAT